VPSACFEHDVGIDVRWSSDGCGSGVWTVAACWGGVAPALQLEVKPAEVWARTDAGIGRGGGGAATVLEREEETGA